MALGILSTRVAPCGQPLKLLVTSSASMSSTSNNTPSTKTVVKKRESFRSMLASVFGGKVDSANPNEEGYDADKVDFPHVVEQATGEAKLLLLAFENGFIDPYCNLPAVRNGRGTKDNPVLIESFINERMVACICEPTQSYARFTNLYKDEPKRCRCGHWMKLVEAPKFWQKIPKEDLLEIPFFRDMEEDGKLDKLLSGELDAEEERKQLGGFGASHH